MYTRGGYRLKVVEAVYSIKEADQYGRLRVAVSRAQNTKSVRGILVHKNIYSHAAVQARVRTTSSFNG